MPVSGGLRRLLRVLEIEEEQRKAQMESLARDLRKMVQGLAAAEDRNREGRRLVMASAATGELADRLAGLDESRAALRTAAALRPRIAETEISANVSRQNFLSKRTERRQAETAIEKAAAAEAANVRRRGQREQDDWFRTKTQRTKDAERVQKRGSSPA